MGRVHLRAHQVADLAALRPNLFLDRMRLVRYLFAIESLSATLLVKAMVTRSSDADTLSPLPDRVLVRSSCVSDAFVTRIYLVLLHAFILICSPENPVRSLR